MRLLVQTAVDWANKCVAGGYLNVYGALTDQPKLGNVSARAWVGPTADKYVYFGFSIAGVDPKDFVVRASGPALASFGFNINDLLQDPFITIEDPQGNVITDLSQRYLSNDNYTSLPSADLAKVAAMGFPLTAKDSGLVARLNPGTYIVRIRGANGGAGVALGEIFDLSPSSNSRFVNQSTRCYVSSGVRTPNLSLIVNGPTDKSYCVGVRAIGPGLALFGLSSYLPNPQLNLLSASTGVLLRSSAGNGSVTAAPISNRLASMGYPPFDNNDSLMVYPLPVGASTVSVLDLFGREGIATIEIAEL